VARLDRWWEGDERACPTAVSRAPQRSSAAWSTRAGGPRTCNNHTLFNTHKSYGSGSVWIDTILPDPDPHPDNANRNPDSRLDLTCWDINICIFFVNSYI
jgi:hypothetical protein